MSTLVAGAALATAMLSNCSWNHPGRNPYRGSIGEAVSRYVDIPVDVRQQLVEKMTAGRADDMVTITRDAIRGRYDYSPQITAMHFGQRTVCDAVTRDQWAASAREPAAVYCVGEECLIVPKICGNVSRVRRAYAGNGNGNGSAAGASAAVGAGGAGGPAAAGIGAGTGQPGGQTLAQAQGDAGDAASRTAANKPVHYSTPDEVAMADTMAQVASDSTQLVPTSAFMSPFGAASTRALAGRVITDPGLDSTQPSLAVPEPATYGMLGGGLAILALLARRRVRPQEAENTVHGGA